MNDLSYLSSPEARRYTVESYDREYKAQECYDIEYHSRLSAAPDTKTPACSMILAEGVTCMNPLQRKGRKEMQNIILKLAKWLIKYVDGYSVHKNPGKRKKA